MKAGIQASCLLALVATMTAPGYAIAPPRPDAFSVALDNGDLADAAKQIEAMKDQRAARNGGNRWLDAYYGRFFAAMAQGPVAEPYLIRAIAAAANRTERDQLAFELARARETSGFVAKAEADYRQLSGSAGDPVRADAIVSLARLRLGAAPDEAVTLLTPLASEGSPAATRWEALLLLSRAYALEGRAADSHAALVAAWQQAPFAPSPADAVAVTSMDMAIDRAEAGDRRGEVGLISVGQGEIPFAGVAQLPVCGDRVRPEDSVTVAIEADLKQRPIYSVVRASRPGIAQLFTVPLAVASQRVDGSATYVTLRCRSTLDPNMRFIGGASPNLATWIAEKGLYPLLRPIDTDAGEPITQLKKHLAELEGKAGPDAPVLAPLLLQLAFMQGAQSRFGNAESLAEAKSMAERAFRILTAAGAPEDVLAQVRVQLTLIFAQNQNIADVTGPTALQAMTVMTARADATPPQAFALFSEMNAWRLRPTDRLALADRLLSFLDARGVAANDPLRQAIELRRASVLREIGTVAGIRDRLAAHGLAADLCASADRPPSIPPAAITLTSEDYPKDLLRRRITGLTGIELSMNAEGKIENERIIVSQPPGLFDAIAADKLKTVTLLPAQRDGKPAACRAMVQTVHWRIPYQGDFSSSLGGFVGSDD